MLVLLALLALAVNLFSFGVIYGLAWVLAWLIGQFVPIPAWLQPVLPWFLFELHLVVGLLVTRDVPGARRAVLRLAGLTAVAGAVIGVLVALLGSQALLPTVALWAGAGVLPWAAALLVEAGR